MVSQRLHFVTYLQGKGGSGIFIFTQGVKMVHFQGFWNLHKCEMRLLLRMARFTLFFRADIQIDFYAIINHFVWVKNKSWS